MSAATVLKKRKAAVAAPTAVAAKPAKKLAGSIDSLMARLEATNAAFLQKAASSAVHAQLARVKATSPPSAAPTSTTSPSLASLPVDPAELARRQERQQRFREEKAAAAAAAGIKDRQKTLVQLRSEDGVARGQNTNLEKEYLRLTALPSAADVRPPEVLREALELVKRRWTDGNEYKDVCSQLKSIRQDLTVQHIRSQLTVQVYETHGRIAIEVGDWAEYRQCHSVLQTLYADGLKGEQREFTAYGLLYAAASGRAVLAHELMEAFSSRSVHCSSVGGGVGSSGGGSSGSQSSGVGGTGSSMIGAPSSGPGDGKDAARGSAEAAGSEAAWSLRQDRFVGHALAACRAFSDGNFVRFLKLYEDAPRMAPYLMDILLAQLRNRAYSTVLAAFQPSIPLKSLSGWFGFSKRTEAVAFLREKGAVATAGQLDIKQSRAALALRQRQQQQQQQLLQLPGFN